MNKKFPLWWNKIARSEYLTLPLPGFPPTAPHALLSSLGMFNKYLTLAMQYVIAVVARDAYHYQIPEYC